MANLSIRRLDEDMYERLQLRAVKHGVSMEEEARQIIYQAVSAPENISQIFQQNFGKKNGINLVLDERKPHLPLRFE